MRNIRAIFTCAAANFRKWYKNPVVILVAAYWGLFLISNLLEIPAISVERGSKMIPWLMPFALLRSNDSFVYSLLLIILFAQAPFNDISAPFTMVRTGRTTWLLGQMLYIVEASAIMTLFTFVCSALMAAPCMDLQLEWGPRLYRMVIDVGLSKNGAAEQIMNSFSVWEAMSLTALLQFLTAVLVGVMILFFNSIRPGIGVLTAGGTAVFSMFAGGKISVLRWSTLFNLHPIVEDGVTRQEAITTMLWLIALFLIGSIILNYKRDAQHTRDDF